MTNFTEVGKFMETFGQEVQTSPKIPKYATQMLRLSLILEEYTELEDAIAEGHMEGIADALTDILYVTYGAGHAFGIDLDKCFEEVQRSNMSKLGADGKPIYRDDGKIMKGPNYSEPDLRKVLNGNS
jgi:predicted HAD superfamily Cof-like phosphohydrolase